MTFLAIQRETIMILALASLTVAGVVFAIGALSLFLRERVIGSCAGRITIVTASKVPEPDPSEPGTP